MIEKKTVVDQIEIARDGTVQIRFGLLLIEDGNEIDCKWHRTALPPGTDVDAQIAAVNAHLGSMGKQSVETGRIALLKDVVALVHTPEAVSAYRERVEATAPKVR